MVEEDYEDGLIQDFTHKDTAGHYAKALGQDSPAVWQGEGSCVAGTEEGGAEGTGGKELGVLRWVRLAVAVCRLDGAVEAETGHKS